jgi:small subunit ribosomal protein S1
MTSEEITTKVDETNQQITDVIKEPESTTVAEDNEPKTDVENTEVVAEPTIQSEETPTASVETPAENVQEASVADESTQPPDIKVSDDHVKEKANEEQFNAIFEKLKAIKESNSTITVNVTERIRGGLRVFHQDVPMFLPASQISSKRSPSEDELKEFIGKDIDVHVHELQEDATKRKTVIVSRKQLLVNDFWKNLKVGQIVEGPVSSIASFGIFIDLGGYEGLVHVSRLSQSHVENPKEYAKKGDVLKAKVVAFDEEKKRISLSTKDLEDSPWVDINSKLAVNAKVKGIVRRLTDFGAYVEVMKGIDGLLRTSELSWTKRVANPSEIVKIGDEIEVLILQINEEKQALTLSLKRLDENPWISYAEKYSPDSIHNSIVKEVVNHGLVVNINNEIDGFMPRSKMKGYLKGNKIPFNVGDPFEIKVVDIDTAKETLIIAPAIEIKVEEVERAPRKKSDKDDRHPRRNREDDKYKEMPSNDGAFSFGDMLSDENKKLLFNKIDK